MSPKVLGLVTSLKYFVRTAWTIRTTQGKVKPCRATQQRWHNRQTAQSCPETGGVHLWL